MTLSAPLTPSDCDLRGLQYMPLLGDRLMDSDLFFESTGDEFKAAVALWWASWKQVPAASLPDNDRILAGLARVHDVRKWAKVRAVALRGWFKCADGRLYHTVVAEIALTAWAERQEHRDAKEAERQRKAAERQERSAMFKCLKDKGIHLAWNVAMADLRRSFSEHCPGAVLNLSGGQVQDCPAPVTAIEVEVKEKGLEEPSSVGSASPTATKAVGKPWLTDPDFRRFWDGSTKEARGRTSQEKTWGPFERAAKKAGGRALIADAYDRYKAEDRDVQRTGGPGLHVWLNDGRWEHYLPKVDAADMNDADWQTAVRLWRSGGDWLPRFGPRPGEPGCRAPTHLILAEATTVSTGSAA